MNINLVQANLGYGKSGGGNVEESPQGLKRLRKNSEFGVKREKSIPQGLKPIFYFQQLAARLKSCPDTKPFPCGVFPQPVKAAVIFRHFRHD
jgi:hypothetical protein